MILTLNADLKFEELPKPGAFPMAAIIREHSFLYNPEKNKIETYVYREQRKGGGPS